jgi:MFS family permease
MSGRARPKGRRRKGPVDSTVRQVKRRIGIAQRLFDFHSRSRKVIAEHHRRRKAREREVSDRSRRGLDWTNFFMADVQVGFGAFLAFYLAGLGWSKQDVGIALTVGGLAGVAAQVPGGALADAVKWKRALAALGIVMIGVSALILALRPTYPLVFTAEVLHGLTAGILGTAIAAISLGLAGRHGLSSRVGRNYRYAAAGNAATAALMGALAAYTSSSAIFVGTALLCVPALIALAQIRPDEIDYVRARNAAKRDHTLDLQRLTDLAKNRNLAAFAACMVLFHFSNASLLTLVGENVGQSQTASSPLLMAGLIIVPQIVVALLAPWVGYWTELYGRKPLLMIAFATEALRALLFAVVSHPSLILLVQLLDGVTGAVFTVLTILVIADFTTGSGRFNLAQGVIGTMTGIAAALSTTVTGFVVHHFSDEVGFLLMAATTGAALVLQWVLVPESKPAKYED